MKKYFVFADAHSFYDELSTALDEEGFDVNNKDHIIISLGDLCDRGPKSREILSFVNSLPEERKVCIIGNHELLMEDMIKRGIYYNADISNGTMKTAVDISENYDDTIADLKNNKLWNEYKKSWHWYYEIEDYIFVHGWIPCIHRNDRFFTEYYKPIEDWRNASKKQFEDATWENGMSAWAHGIREEGKTIFCGHWNTSWGNCYLHGNGSERGEDANHNPFIDEGIVALDASTVISHKINIYVFEVEDNSQNLK